MANRPKGFGMTAELQRARDAKYDSTVTGEVVQWMNLVLKAGDIDEELDQLLDADECCPREGFQKKLKDGVVLCKLINCIKPGIVKKINGGTMSFKQMENINNFLTSCEEIGCKKMDLFQTVDLYEYQNIPQVVNGIIALGRKAQTIGYDGPCLGPSESSENKREFTEEQMNAGKNVIGLQAGTNKCASQAGQNFGKTRSIVD